MVLELGMLGIVGKLLVSSVTSNKENFKKINLIYSSRAAQNPIDHNMVDWNFRD